MVERDGNVHRRVVADITGATLKNAIRQYVQPSAKIVTDEFLSYKGIGKSFFGGHAAIQHGLGEYVRGDVHTNTAESSFALLKRGLVGIYQAVSKQHFHRYVSEFDFRWNTRKMNDCARTVKAIQDASGKRLIYSRHAQT